MMAVRALTGLLRATVAALALCAAPAAVAGTDVWTPIGPFGGGIVRLAEDPADPARVYADAFDPYRLYRSRDAGRNWQPAALPPSGNVDEYQSYFPGNGAIYALGFASTAWRSVDGGSSWTALPQTPNELRITVAEPGNPQVVYGIASIYDIVKSVDGGATWTLLRTDTSDVNGWSGMVIDEAAPSTVYVYGSSRILKSTDAGANWSVVPTGLGFFSVASVVPFGPTLLVATYGQGFLRSTDGGATWAPSNGGIADPRIYSLVKGPGATPVLYATAGSPDWPALLRSVDGGNNWAPTGAAGIVLVLVSRHVPNRLYGITVGTVAVSDDAGATWSIDGFASGLPNARTPTVLVDAAGASKLYAAAEGLVGSVRSTDGGRSWVPITLPNGTIVQPVSASPTQPGTVYAIASQANQPALRSTDFGVDWAPLGIDPGTYVAAIAEAASDPRVVYVAGALDCGSTAHLPKYCAMVKRSGDGGTSWTDVSQGLPGTAMRLLAVAGSDPRVAFVGDGSRVWATTDGGGTWTDRSAGLPGGPVLALVASPANSAVLYAALDRAYSGPGEPGVYVTLDGGVSWSARSAGLPDAFVSALAIDPLDPAILYAGVGGFGVFRSGDAGMHWAPFGAGLDGETGLSVRSIAIDRRDTRNVYIGTDRGAYALTYTSYGAVDHAIEFYEPAFDHYFVAVETQPDVMALDSALITGWMRTGRAFPVYPLAAAGTTPVCRFWSGQTFAPKSSHFYTPYANECAFLKQQGVWQYEGDVFALWLPSGAPGFGTCAAGSAPLYRLYNNGQGGAPNHRYTDDLAVVDQMAAQGWVFEGEAQTKVFACIPAAQ